VQGWARARACFCAFDLAQAFQRPVKRWLNSSGVHQWNFVWSTPDQGVAMPACCSAQHAHSEHFEVAGHAERLTALAREARLLEFGFEGQGAAATGLATVLEDALTEAMDADSPAELTHARNAIDCALGRLTELGMRLSAELSEIELDGVLGKSRMPVLSAVLSA
jgi:hypothetical protein